MILSSVFRWLIVLVLIPTMTWKIVLQPENLGETHEAVVRFLKGEKFDVHMTDESIEDMPVIEARNETCRLRIARVSPFGHEAELVRRVSTAGDQIFYVFLGVEYQEQPVRRTLVSYFWFRFLRELGWVSRIPPVFAVMTSCENEQIPWADMDAQEPTSELPKVIPQTVSLAPIGKPHDGKLASRELRRLHG
jgi:hypothetical protein